jgi:hypothetical protein
VRSHTSGGFEKLRSLASIRRAENLGNGRYHWQALERRALERIQSKATPLKIPRDASDHQRLAAKRMFQSKPVR